jgi:hypothetical protein
MTPTDKAESQELPQFPTSPAGSRRRLLRGGLAAAPALLTLASRPVLATQTCFPGSASVSANASRTAAGLACRGRTVNYWSQDSSFTEWPAPMASPGSKVQIAAANAVTADATKNVAVLSGTAAAAAAPTDSKLDARAAATTFNSVFGTQGGYGTKTLVDVLRLNATSGRDGLAAHLVAAYLNALKGFTPSVVLDVVTVKNIWTSFVARGYYEPTAGIRWFPDHAQPANPRGGLIAWIKTTMPS